MRAVVRLFAAFFAALGLVSASAAVAAEAPAWEEGKHYQVLPYPVRTANLDKIEVVELFWYGCPHCYHFKPLFEAWEKALPDDVNVVMLPAVLGDQWESGARAFYAAEALGVHDKVHGPLFDAMARDRKQLGDDAAMTAFMGTLGINETEFRSAYNSFAVKAKVDSAISRVRGYRAMGVPALVVNGKYRISGQEAGSQEAMLKVAEYLIGIERAAIKTK